MLESKSPPCSDIIQRGLKIFINGHYLNTVPQNRS